MMKRTDKNIGDTIHTENQNDLENTLEFLNLDDDTIKRYGKSDTVKENEEFEEIEDIEDEFEEPDADDEDLEEIDGDDDDFDEFDEDDEEDEDYDEFDEEDDDLEEIDFDDEEYEETDEEDNSEIVYGGNIFRRFGYFVIHMNPLDRVVAIFGCFILITAVITGSLYLSAKTESDRVEAFAEVGAEMEGIHVIGESGLLAVSNAEAARLSQMIAADEKEQEPEEKEEETVIEVGINLTSIQSDLKIKFINTETNKLIGSVPFEVEVTRDGGKSYVVKDEDKDGIIYQTDIDAGTYTVKANALEGEEYRKYRMPAKESSVKVTDTIAYKKVDVADEIKKESEINAAAEDTAQQMQTESALTDTVEWVESTKTEISSEESYKEINKSEIPDPSTLGRISGFMKLALVDDVIPQTAEQQTDKERNEEKLKALNPTLSAASVSIDMSKETSVSLSISVSAGESYFVDWKSNNTAVAEVYDGVVTALSNGSATITATVTVGDDPNTSASKQLSCTVSVTGGATEQPSDPAKEYKMKSVTGGGTIQVGKTCTVVGTTDPEGGVVTWSSNDKKIATVDANGVVTGVSVGTTSIRGTSSSGDYKECSVTVVSSEVTYKSVTITGSSTIQVGKTGSVKGTTDPAGGTVKWTSDNEKVVKIDSNGNMTGVSEGSATITGTCGGAKGTFKVTVTKDAATDSKSKLKDKNGNQIYVKNADGSYVEATYADYYKNQKFYLKSKTAQYRYTGWQTIDGYTYFFDKNGNYVTGEQVIQGARYTFGSDGRLSSGSGTMGIDVSKHNGNIDWNAVRNSGVSFAIIRCGYRGSATGVLVEDEKFRTNIKGAKAAGLKVGVYFFCQAVNEIEAVEEASMAVSLVSSYGLDMPIFLDVESAGGRGDRISKEARTAVCRAFCQTVQNSGYSAGIYANKTWFNEKINVGSLTSYKIWLAQYASTPTYTTTRYDMWQYSSKGRINGISGDVDLDIRYY